MRYLRGTVQKIAKNRKKSTFSCFKPNYLKKRGNDFEFFFRDCRSNDTLSPQKNCMSRKIPVREIFAPESAKNRKKLQKNDFFQVSRQIVQKREPRVLIFLLRIVLLMTFYHFKIPHVQKDSGSWDICAGLCKKLQKITKIWIFSRFMANSSKNILNDNVHFFRNCSFIDILSPSCPGRFSFLRYLQRTVLKIAKNRKKQYFFEFQAKLFKKERQRFRIFLKF